MLTNYEEDFKHEVLLRGEQEGIWVVDAFIAGGSLQWRTAFGIDFAIQSPKTGVIINIEYKKNPHISLTSTQKQRFQNERDAPKRVTRMCIAINTTKYKDDYIIAAYWSPAFFKRLPEALFHQQKPQGFGREGAFLLSLGEFEKGLDSNMNNILCNLKSGNIGFPHTRYRHMDQKEVFDWFYEKLKQTLENPLEEEGKGYVPYILETPIFKLIEDKADELIINLIKQKYRPIYAEDLINILERDTLIASYIKKSLKKEILDVPIMVWIKNRLNRIVKINKEVAEVKIDGYTPKSWGIKNKEYLPLTKGASNLLDILKKMYNRSGKTYFSSMELVRTLRIKSIELSHFIYHYRKELCEKGLAEITHERARHFPNFFKLKPLAIKYFTGF